MLDLNSIINIDVNFPSVAAQTENFSLGMIFGQTASITPAERVKIYSSIEAVIADGFSDNTAIINAATKYFSQFPQPSELAIGVQVAPGTANISTMTTDSPTLVVDSTATMYVGEGISGTGIPVGTTILAITNSTTITMSANATATESSGTLTLSGETAVEAMTAIREANPDWYIGCLIGASASDIQALAAYVESASPAAIQFYTTSDPNVLTNAQGNICGLLQSSKYRRSFGQYSTYPDAVVAIMGYACGEGLTSFDLAFKAEQGVTPDNLTVSQATTLKNLNCNYYAPFNNIYNLFVNGVMADGSHFDDVLGIDTLTANIQAGITELMMSATKIPLTDAGMLSLTKAIEGACDKALATGFIAPGIWTGSNILDLQTGTTLANGYYVQASSVTSLTSEEIANRTAPPIYVCIILAESGESFTITVNANR